MGQMKKQTMESDLLDGKSDGKSTKKLRQTSTRAPYVVRFKFVYLHSSRLNCRLPRELPPYQPPYRRTVRPKNRSQMSSRALVRSSRDRIIDFPSNISSRKSDSMTFPSVSSPVPGCFPLGLPLGMTPKRSENRSQTSSRALGKKKKYWDTSRRSLSGSRRSRFNYFIFKWTLNFSDVLL